MSQTDGAESVGSVAEEAAKLLGALSGWAREHGDGVSGVTAAATGTVADELHEHLATGSPACTWCPVCRTVSAVRGTSPEVRAHLASAASSLLLAVTGMLATQTPRRDTSMEHIDLDADAGDWPEDET